MLNEIVEQGHGCAESRHNVATRSGMMEGVFGARVYLRIIRVFFSTNVYFLGTQHFVISMAEKPFLIC
jgi:hypothetical protein